MRPSSVGFGIKWYVPEIAKKMKRRGCGRAFQLERIVRRRRTVSSGTTALWRSTYGGTVAGPVCWKGRRNTLEHKAWSKWLTAADALAHRYCAVTEKDDPFAYNETASVSVLAAAAACAGYVGLADFSTSKALRENRGHGRGRSDFWMQAAGRSWAFEFKQWMPVTAPRKRLVSHMAAAEGCAKKIVYGAAQGAVAGLIVPLYWIRKGRRGTREEVLQRARANLQAFAKECDFAWTVGGANGGPETWLLFKIARRWW